MEVDIENPNPATKTTLSPENCETCVNCCAHVDIISFPPNFYEVSLGTETAKISSIMSNVFHLNFPKDFAEEENLPENSALCEPCTSVFTSLSRFYREFEKLRSLESLLAKKIVRLDEIIERGLKLDPYPSEGSGAGTETVKIEPKEMEEVVIPVDPYLQSSNGKNGPWVRLKRLRPEDVGTGGTNQKQASGIGSKRSGSESSGFGVNFKSDNDGDFAFFEENTTDRSDPESLGSLPKRRKRLTSKVKQARSKREKDRNQKRVQKESQNRRKASSQKQKLKDSAVSFENSDNDVDTDGNPASGNGASEETKTQKRKRIFKPTHGRFYELFYRRQLVHPFPCVYCELDFDTESDRAEHLQTAHVSKSKPEFCSKCGKVFGDESRKKVHEPKCGTIPPGVHLPPYNCEHCNKEYPSWSKLSTHMRQVHVAERRFACDQCPYKTIAPSLLENHRQRVHTVTEEVQCSECQKVLKSQELYLSHYDRMHGEGHELYKQQLIKSSQRRREKRKPPLTSFVCPLCSVDFLTKNRLTNHRLAVHETEKKHMCDQCGKSFINPGRLRKHIEYTHTEERPFICDQCGKNFKSMDNLKCHIVRSHTEEGRLKYNEYTRRKNRHRQMVAMAQSTLQSNPSEKITSAGSEMGEQVQPQQLPFPPDPQLISAFQHSMCE